MFSLMYRSELSGKTVTIVLFSGSCSATFKLAASAAPEELPINNPCWAAICRTYLKASASEIVSVWSICTFLKNGGMNSTPMPSVLCGCSGPPLRIEPLVQRQSTEYWNSVLLDTSQFRQRSRQNRHRQRTRRWADRDLESAQVPRCGNKQPGSPDFQTA